MKQALASQIQSLYEKNLPSVVHGLEDITRQLQTIPLLHSLESLINCWPHLIGAHLPDLRDEASSLDVSSKDAQKLYDNGMGLLFDEAQNFSPILKECLELCRKSLGLSALTYGRCLIYATPDGKGTAAHFDQNINFVLQIQGTKKWLIAPNEHVINPLTRHTMGQAADPEMMSYLAEALPESMPKAAQNYVLKPGSILYVPRGYWHATEAEGDALALNFTFTAPTWIDLMTAALRGRLALSPEWRETAEGVSAEGTRADAEKRFDDLLKGLIQDLPYWQASDILDATDPQED